MKYSAEQQHEKTPTRKFPNRARFDSDFQGRDPRPATWNILDDSLAENQRWSTWPELEKLMRGPRPTHRLSLKMQGPSTQTLVS